jgi:hypothetical protein
MYVLRVRGFEDQDFAWIHGTTRAEILTDRVAFFLFVDVRRCRPH